MAFDMIGGQNFLLPEWGSAFFYHGPVEDAYIRYLKSLPEEEDVRILIPACGRGRLVLDTLATHTKARVFANEILEANFHPLQTTLAEFFPGTDRVENLFGDIELRLKNIDDHSINAVYIGHLFHFFSPEKIRRCMKEIWRVLKPEGRVFLVWLGSARKPYQMSSNSTVKNYEREKQFLTNLGLKNPSFLFSETLSKAMQNPYLSTRPVFPYNNSNIHEMLTAVGEAFDHTESGEHFGIGAGISLYGRILNLGDYRFEALNEISKVKRSNYTLTNYLILRPKSLESAQKFLEEEVLNPEEESAFYIAREEQIKENIGKHSCDQCKKLFSNIKELMRCRACSGVKYSSRACQKDDWPNHKAQCKIRKDQLKKAKAQAASSTSTSI